MGAIRPSGGTRAKVQGAGTIGQGSGRVRTGAGRGIDAPATNPPLIAHLCPPPPSPPPQPTYTQRPTDHGRGAKRQNFWG
jgi:hypothetical protein